MLQNDAMSHINQTPASRKDLASLLNGQEGTGGLEPLKPPIAEAPHAAILPKLKGA